MKIINYEKKKEIILTNEEKESYEKQKNYYICEKEFCTDENKNSEFKLYHKVRDHCHYSGKYRGAAHNICNLRYKILKEIHIVFHNGSTYDYHFIIKKLIEEFKGKVDCLGENTEKYITFSVPIKKELNNNKVITYKLKFIDSFRFMADSLSSLIDNLSEINKKESMNEFMLASLSSLANDLSEINKEPANEFINNFKMMIATLSSHIDNLSEINKKESVNEFEKFPNTYRFCKGDLSKFALLLRKGVYPYEHMDCWEKFSETSLPNKESFYSELNKECITDEDHVHAQKVWEVFEIKNLGEYHDLYVQSDTLLLADIFENFRDRRINTYKLDPTHFLSAPGFAWQACLKKTGVKLELLTDNDMLMMAEEGIRGGV